jgi:hypothetical protein
LRYGDIQSRGFYRTNNGADKWYNRISNAGCTHQDMAIPAINAVIAGASEDIQRRWDIEGCWKLYRKCMRLHVFTSHRRP